MADSPWQESRRALACALARLIARGDLLALCAERPSNYAQAACPPSAGGVELGRLAITPGLAPQGDYRIMPDGKGGLRLTLTHGRAIPVCRTGIAGHIALLDRRRRRLLLTVPLAAALAVETGARIAVPGAPSPPSSPAPRRAV